LKFTFLKDMALLQNPTIGAQVYNSAGGMQHYADVPSVNGMYLMDTGASSWYAWVNANVTAQLPAAQKVFVSNGFLVLNNGKILGAD